MPGVSVIALAQEEPPESALELVAVVPPQAGITPDVVEALCVRAAHPEQIVFATQNVGADCGGGTPASAWKLTLDPNGHASSVLLKQHLSQIQNVRSTIFEASDGTLFTGGGWCGPKPPYVSFDGGESWRPADHGAHMPNSTFCYAEFEGRVYAGTGYDPYDSEIYRWLSGSGADDWEHVFTVTPRRPHMTSLAEYEGRLFAASGMWQWSWCESTTTVYVSPDGENYAATAGISGCISGQKLLIVDGTLLLTATDPWNSANASIYRWEAGTEAWTAPVSYPLGMGQYRAQPVAIGGSIYAYGQKPGDPIRGIYRSSDLGVTWEQIAAFPAPEITALCAFDNVLYAGTARDGSNQAYIYRLPLVPPLRGDLNCDGVVDFHDITPFALAVTNWGRYLRLYPHCDIYLADINGDGYVDFDDINPFVALLAGS